jgi:hypothetical protein
VPLCLQHVFEVIQSQQHISSLFTEQFCKMDSLECQNIHSHICLLLFFHLSATETPRTGLLYHFHCLRKGSRIEVQSYMCLSIIKLLQNIAESGCLATAVAAVEVEHVSILQIIANIKQGSQR